MAEALAFREIAHDDIDKLAAMVADAFVGYRAFAPAGWQPPSAGEQARGLQEWIADPGFWGELASEEQTDLPLVPWSRARDVHPRRSSLLSGVT